MRILSWLRLGWLLPSLYGELCRQEADAMRREMLNCDPADLGNQATYSMYAAEAERSAEVADAFGRWMAVAAVAAAILAVAAVVGGAFALYRHFH